MKDMVKENHKVTFAVSIRDSMFFVLLPVLSYVQKAITPSMDEYFQ